MILEKVSFDDFLFEKELKKAVKNIEKEEAVELENWCRKYFQEKHKSPLNRIFSSSRKQSAGIEYR